MHTSSWTIPPPKSPTSLASPTLPPLWSGRLQSSPHRRASEQFFTARWPSANMNPSSFQTLFSASPKFNGRSWQKKATIILSSRPDFSGFLQVPMVYVYMEVSWNRGTPSHHPFLDGIFHIISQPFWGSPMTMETITCCFTSVVEIPFLSGMAAWPSNASGDARASCATSQSGPSQSTDCR